MPRMPGFVVPGLPLQVIRRGHNRHLWTIYLLVRLPGLSYSYRIISGMAIYITQLLQGKKFRIPWLIGQTSA